MNISYSQLSLFQFCPLAWQEKYVGNVVAKPGEPLIFGGRIAQLLEEHRKHEGLYTALSPEKDPTGALEREAQAMMAAYLAHYPVEPFEIVSVETEHRIAIPKSSHVCIVKFDALVRDKATGRLQILETKTESRSSRANTIEAWNTRAQVSIYQWAAEQVYGEPVDKIIIDVCTRQSPKGQELCSFRRQETYRTPEQIEEALYELKDAADRIEAYLAQGRFPRHSDNCVNRYGWKCDYYTLHNVEDSEQIRAQICLPWDRVDC